MEHLEGIIKLVLGDREYELLPILRDGEDSVTWAQVSQRAQAANALLGEEDANWFVAHQAEIPVELEQFGLIFTEWRFVKHPTGIPCLRCRPKSWWRAKKWVDDWLFVSPVGANDGRLVRRVK